MVERKQAWSSEIGILYIVHIIMVYNDKDQSMQNIISSPHARVHNYFIPFKTKFFYNLFFIDIRFTIYMYI